MRWGSVALLTQVPDFRFDIPMIELEGAGYQRGQTRLVVAKNGLRIVNEDTVGFGQAKEDWPPIEGFAVYDVDDPTTPLYFGPLNGGACRNIKQGEYPRFSPGAIVLEIH